MNSFALLFDITFAAILAYIVGVTIWQFRKETGTTWERLLATAQDSATMLWGKLVLVAAGIAANLDNLTTALNMPELQSWLHQVIGNPQVLAGIMAAIGFVSMIARMRSLFSRA